MAIVEQVRPPLAQDPALYNAVLALKASEAEEMRAEFAASQSR